MNKTLLLILLSIITISCSDKEKEQVDLIVSNAKIYTVDTEFSNAEAFAIKDGKFVAVGTSEEIQEKYQATETLDANGKAVLPGFIDAHCHFYGLGLNKQSVNLVGTKSFDEIITKLEAFQKEKNAPFITGRGWDQNDWEVKEFPTKERLDKLFPNTPVALTRVDGHAYLVNQKALDMAGITSKTKIFGGEIQLLNGKLTGIIIDNPMDLIDKIIPQPNRMQQIQALQDAEKECFSYGLTTVNDAGLNKNTINLIDSLQKADALHMRVYAMISNTPENVAHYIDKKPYKTDYLNVRSFKVYGDGALGSRGAVLKESYSDKENHFGAMVISPEELEKLAIKIAKTEYQMNTHAIGDSANYQVLKTYANALKGQTNRRWKVEHAQVIDETDFDLFTNKNIIPSVQPTHATSDMYWAGERLGNERVKGAYAYKKLLNLSGKIALGTDFPVEYVSTFKTFYAAVARKDSEYYPKDGYQIENALSREETLKGMTIWAAYSNFEENEKGSIEVGKFADFIILDKNIMEIPEDEILSTTVEETYLAGKKVK
ncbi:N-substituted formamide deformylase [Kordia antarctica]|uniref:N-substituted formamide deformylase n=1 Tax=Kordia antarctica TaxID=1218801 RepID=A0A7L4ZIJ1_9FLAO|nr:amidohydrolase [Kordia antarctica]QHI36340.1 N-substituted formamide deformylase [Kordia antarctica]